jgi:hypothetical protein
MKKLSVLSIAMMLTFGSLTLCANDRTNPVSTTVTEKMIAEREINVLKIRIEAIKAIDKTTLTRDEKQELRSELREMRRDLKQKTQASSGVYISTGLIIVILLLIILL